MSEVRIRHHIPRHRSIILILRFDGRGAPACNDWIFSYSLVDLYKSIWLYLSLVSWVLQGIPQPPAGRLAEARCMTLLLASVA